jgi:hypothetical protein
VPVAFLISYRQCTEKEEDAYSYTGGPEVVVAEGTSFSMMA